MTAAYGVGILQVREVLAVVEDAADASVEVVHFGVVLSVLLAGQAFPEVERAFLSVGHLRESPVPFRCVW